MQNLIKIATIALVAISCGENTIDESWADAQQKEAVVMTMSPVTAGDYGGSVPVASISCPDAGEDVKAEDIRAPVAALLANDDYLKNQREVMYEFQDVPPASPFVVGPPNSFTGNTWTDSKMVTYVVDTLVNDDIVIDVWGNWQLNASGSPGDVVGKLRVQLTENYDGTPVTVNLYGNSVIGDDGGNLTLPHNEPYAMHFRYRTTNAGKTKVAVQVRSEDLTGGAATGTIILMFSARMDILHVKRN